MEPAESQGQSQTEIIEEKPTRSVRTKPLVWVFLGIGGGLVVVALFLFLGPGKRRTQDPPILSADDREQQRYDAQQEQQARNKAAQIHNDPLIFRKGSEAEVSSEVEDLLRSLNLNDSQSPVKADRAQAEEDLIANVIREPQPQAPRDPSYLSSRPPAPQPTSAATSSSDGDKPMFVYSRSFGGAKYHDAARKETTREPRPSGQAPLPAVNVSSKADAPKPLPQASVPKSEKASLLYTEHAPVTLYEGEVLDAVLVNRIIADTEPSPVVSHLSKDVFDTSGQFVVFPVNSRIVGYSQVVNYKGAHRLFISFHRIILPNGPSADFPQSSKTLKALDETGALGVVSKLDRHWWLQFGTAIFVGVLDGLGAAAQRSGDLFSRRAIIIDNTSRNFELILDRIMQQYSNIVPTISVQQGKKLKIYLSDDLLVTPYARIQDRSYAVQ
jgi:type IV secretion system protein TrbI